MTGLEPLVKMEREARRRMDDGTRDLAIGAMLFSFSAGLDLGRIPLMPLVFIPMFAASMWRGLVWPRVGFARERTGFVAEIALLFGLSFLALLAVSVSVGVTGMTGLASGLASEDRSRLVSVAAIVTLPLVLGLLAVRLHLPRYGAYALAILLAFASGPFFGLRVRAWALALLAVAILVLGGLRLHLFVRNSPVLAASGDQQ